MKGIKHMKKRFFAILLAICSLASSAAFAEEIIPTITTSTEREICLDVPRGKFTNGVFMVPVRRICEMFNASCDWYGEEQRIIINTPDNITRLFLYIGNDTLQIFTFTSVITGTNEYLPLDAPLEIVNDRTLVPFEQICRALKGECVWSEDKSSVTVKVPAELSEDRAEIYLKADAQDIKAGDEITVDIMAKNLDISDKFDFIGYSAGVIFNKSEFEYVSAKLEGNTDPAVEYIKAENINFTDDSIKTVCLNPVAFDYGDEDVCIGKIVLKALTDNGGEVKLSNRIYTIGDDTALVYSHNETSEYIMLSRGTQLKIDTTPVTLN